MLDALKAAGWLIITTTATGFGVGVVIACVGLVVRAAID